MKSAVSLYEFMPYGAPDLLQSRRERMALALVLGSALAVALYAAAGVLTALIASAPVSVPPPIVVTVIPQPPPLVPTLVPKAEPPAATKTPVAGIPIPVPDATVPKDQTIAAQPDMSKVAPQSTSDGGGLVIEPQAVDTLPGLGEYVYVEELPVPITEITPPYPDVPRDAGVDGLVMVNVLVGRDGRVIDARLDPKHQVPMLNEAALAAARLWVFKPALANDRPVAVWTAIPFNFRLH
jgi:protein TonB